jgi:lysozyme family protein
MMTVDEFIADYIKRWEGGLSLHKEDAGNYASGKAGVGPLIGSKYGVTPSTLASHRKVPAASITPAQMAALTMDEAVAIGRKAYYDAPRFGLLPWNRITASIVDMGWGAGPTQAIKLLQRMIGVADDGKLGPNTARAYATWLEARQAKEWEGVRNAFYDLIIDRKPANAKFRNGWRNRSAYFTPDSDWWGRFVA